MLVTLLACSGDIFSVDAFLRSHRIVVGMQSYDLARRGFQFHIGRELGVIGEFADESIATLAY